VAPPVPQAVGTLTAGNAAISVPWPAHLANDIGVLVLETMGEVVPAVSGWNQFPSSPQRSGPAGVTDTELTMYWKRAASGAEANAEVGDSGNHQIGVIGTIRGCVTTGDPFDVTTGDILATADTAVSIPGHTTTVADCLIVAACSAGTDTSTAQFSAWANADLTSVAEWFDLFAITANGGGFGVATGVKAAAGAFGATTATLATSSEQGRIVIAFKPPAGGAQEVAINPALETDAAQALGRVKARTASPALETDAAQALGRQKSRTLVPALETDLAVVLARSKVRLLGVALETDQALAITRVVAIVVAINPALETDEARPVGRTKARTLIPALETDVAVALGRVSSRLLGVALEIDEAMPFIVVTIATWRSVGTLEGSPVSAPSGEIITSPSGRIILVPPGGLVEGVEGPPITPP